MGLYRMYKKRRYVNFKNREFRAYDLGDLVGRL